MCWLDVPACATSSNIKVRANRLLDNHFGNVGVVALAWPTLMLALLHGICADTKVVYRRYASLFFVMGIAASDNELVALEVIHRYVELLDKYFGNVRTIEVREAVIIS